jgi:hypothetical protein
MRQMNKAQAPRIDWDESFRGLGAAMAAAQHDARRGAPQHNLADFNSHSRKPDGKARR